MAATLPVVEHEASELSPWRMHSILGVMDFGFVTLIAITTMGYRDAPPIPKRVVGPGIHCLWRHPLAGSRIEGLAEYSSAPDCDKRRASIAAENSGRFAVAA